MDIGVIRGLITAVLLILFIGIAFWSYDRRRESEFRKAASLALDEDGADADRSANSNEVKS